MRHWQLGMCLLLLVTGCMPRTVVRQNPGPDDRGVRYYRPKPYLLVQPTPVNEDAAVRHDKYVQISLDYLPDFSEEYSIDVRTGLGRNKTSLKLTDGWNLTEINQELDSNFDENVKAIGDLLKSAAPGGIVPTASEPARGPSMVVRATNVPIGYYESVIDRGPDCKKRLYGWRCSVSTRTALVRGRHTGTDCVDCHGAGVYGLVFRDGVMTFEIIHDVAQRIATQVEQLPAPLSRRPRSGRDSPGPGLAGQRSRQQANRGTCRRLCREGRRVTAAPRLHVCHHRPGAPDKNLACSR